MKPKKRILLINWRDINNPEAGGAEIYYHEIFKRLATEHDYSVTVLSHLWLDASATEKIDGTRVIRIGSRLLFNFSVIPWVQKHQQEFDLIIEDLNKAPFFTPLYTKKPRLHLVMHFFGTAIFKEINFPMASYIYLMEKMVPVFYKRERFVAISNSTGREVTQFTGNQDAVDIVEPGIDCEAFYPSQEKASTPLLVYVGRIKKYKNIQFIINCLPEIRKDFPSTHLIVAGSGDYQDELKKLTHESGLDDAVEFAGFISETEKRDLLSRATLKINPSVKEGWGITNIEANLCGTISISSNVPGLCDSVKDGTTGILFRYNDRRDFVGKVKEMLEDSDRRTQMEKTAVSYAKEFNWDTITQRMNRAIEKVI
ncbi:MAG: glycosyltransferase [Chitinivibrionales bacterium]|nr:glycosyltransferase [Chitinivibrionales bacterium]